MPEEDPIPGWWGKLPPPQRAALILIVAVASASALVVAFVGNAAGVFGAFTMAYLGAVAVIILGRVADPRSNLGTVIIGLFAIFGLAASVLLIFGVVEARAVVERGFITWGARHEACPASPLDAEPSSSGELYSVPFFNLSWYELPLPLVTLEATASHKAQ